MLRHDTKQANMVKRVTPHKKGVENEALKKSSLKSLRKAGVTLMLYPFENGKSCGKRANTRKRYLDIIFKSIL